MRTKEEPSHTRNYSAAKNTEYRTQHLNNYTPSPAAKPPIKLSDKIITDNKSVKDFGKTYAPSTGKHTSQFTLSLLGRPPISNISAK